jgi:hypothetical protein
VSGQQIDDLLGRVEVHLVPDMLIQVLGDPGRGMAFLAAERGHEDETIVVIHRDCPLHKIVTKPMDDALGEL